MPTRKYNPGFLADDELVATFCVRTNEFESIVETLHENDGNSNQHLVVIGPRGSGKTSLLLRVAAEVHRNSDLSSRLFPITFAEESYEVGTCGEFWLESLDRLARQAPQAESAAALRRTWEDLRGVRDDQSLAERCLGALLDFSDHIGKRLVVVVENFNTMLRDMIDPDSGWRLRKTLQTEPRIILLGSATSRFDEIDNPDQALYDIFRVINLRPLSTTECGLLWKSICGESSPDGQIRSLEILTGGNPRLIAIVAKFGAGRPFHELMDDLLELIDEHTEYFKSHLDSLPHQERRVYLALADLWKPATTREIADRARLTSSTCSAQLKRLIDRGVVIPAGGTARRKQYYLAERMYNIYYLLRRGGSDSVVRALIRFMASFYSQSDLIVLEYRLSAEARQADDSVTSLYQIALTQLRRLPEYYEGLRHDTTKLTEYELHFQNMYSELFAHGRYQAALQVCDEILNRTGAGKYPPFREFVANVLLIKGESLRLLNRPLDALEVYDAAIRRLETSEMPSIAVTLSYAMVNKGAVLNQLNRQRDALNMYDEVLLRFGAVRDREVQGGIAAALVDKGTTLGQLGRPEDAIAIFDAVVSRFGSSARVAKAMVNKGVALAHLRRESDALVALGEMIKRFGSSTDQETVVFVARGRLNKAIILSQLNRNKESIEIYDGLVSQFRNSPLPELRVTATMAIVNRAVLDTNFGFLTDKTSYERDLRTTLLTLQTIESLPDSAILRALTVFSVNLGPSRALELIRNSAAAELLLPLVTALEQEVGHKPRVAREVDEVAQDIRKELARIRTLMPLPYTEWTVHN
ncbi:MAG: tetratricopeptide repeat protein [Gammaproteobacteria bacterium]|nr:tetratricopeptide repeat protein [Gammaproteobacteria bacterium]